MRPNCDGGPPWRPRPYQYSTPPDVYQRPLMFSTIHSVYWIGPSQPGGVTSGQRQGPSFFEKSTNAPSLRRSSVVMSVVTGQLATSAGDEAVTVTP